MKRRSNPIPSVRAAARAKTAPRQWPIASGADPVGRRGDRKASPAASVSLWRAKLRKPAFWLGLAIVIGAFVWSYWTVLGRLIHAWNHEPDYSHGYLILPAALLFLWMRRERLPAPGERLYWGGMALLAAGAAIRLAGCFWYVAPLEAWSIPFWAAGACWLLGGRRLLAWALPSVAFLGFMIPLPFRAEGLLSLPLQRLATQLSCWLLQSLGRPAVAEGNVIYLNDLELEVAAACSGLRIFMSILTLAYVYLMFTRRDWRIKVLLVASVLPIALATNAARIVATGLLYEWVSGEAAHHFSHDLAGWLMAPLAAGLFGLASWYFGRLAIEAEAALPEELMRGAKARAPVDRHLRAPVRVWNVRLLLRSAAAAAAIGAGAYYWHDFQAARNAVALLDRAGQMEKREQWLAAAQSIHRFLRLRPDDAGATVRLAEDFDRAAKSPREKSRAVEFFAAAIALAPQRADIRSRHLTLLFEAGDYLAALRHADELLKLEPNAPAALRIRALALLEQFQARGEATARAVARALETALDYNPADLALAVHLARLYRNQLNSGERADRVLDLLVLQAADEARALLARYAYRREFGLAGADDDLERLLALDADARSLPIRLAAAGRAQERQDWPAAERYFRDVVRIDRRERRGHLGLGLALSAQGNLTAALDAWRKGLDQSDDRDMSLLTQAADAEIRLRQWQAAGETLDRIERQARNVFGRERSAQLATAYSLRAEWRLAQDDLRAAIPLLKKALLLRRGEAETKARIAGDARLYAELGQCHARLAEWDQAAAACQKAADLQLEDAAARLTAAAAWALAGRLDESARQYEQALAIGEGAAAAWISYAQVTFRRQLIASEPNWPEFERIVAEAQARLGDESSKPADRATLALLNAEYQIQRRDSDAALAILRQIEPEALAEAELAGALIFDYERLGRRDDADRALAAFAKRADAGPKAMFLKIDLLSGRRQFEEAERLLTDALQGAAADDERAAILHRRGMLYLAQDEHAAARQQFEELARLAPQDRRAAALLAEIALARGDLPGAERWEHRLRQISGDDDAQWRYYRAQRLLSQAAAADRAPARQPLLADAAKLQSEVESLRPNWPAGYLLKARLAQLAPQPEPEEAIRNYAEAIRLGETRLEVYQALVSLLYQQNRLAEAAGYLDRLPEATELPPALTTMALAVDARQGHLSRAIDRARREVERQPADAMRRVWLGELLAQDAPADEAARRAARLAAEAELQRAVDMAPKDLRTWSALLAFYAKTRQTSSARELLEKLDAEGLGEGDDRRQAFVLAQGYALLGDRQRARSLYLEAVEANRDSLDVQLQAARYFLDADAGLARQCVERALELAPNQRDAMQLLALLKFRAGGTEQDLEEVYRLLDRSGSDPADISDRRLQALFLLRRGGAAARRRARRILESLVNANGTSNETDRLLLARLYEMDGDAVAAREQLRELAGRDAASADQLAAYIDFSLRTGQAAAAGETLERLARLEPENEVWRTVSLRARWLKAVGDASRIAGLVQAYLERARPKLEDAIQQSLAWLNAGELYSLVEMDREAEAAYRQAVQLESANLQVLALWLARRGRASEAIRSCLAAASADATSQTARTLSSILHLDQVPEELQGEAEAVLAAALERHPNDAELAFDVATLRLFRGENAEALRLLRLSLELDPKNLNAMNNLAILLAGRPESRAEAIEWIDRALALAGADPELLDSKGWILLLQQDAAEAEALFREAISAPPADPRRHFHLALACQMQGRLDQAREALRMATEAKLQVNLLSPEEVSRYRALQAALR